MTDDEFYTFLETARAELRQKQDHLQVRYGFGHFARFWHNQETETLQFFDASNTLQLEVDVIYIGSYAGESNTWMWGWSNTSMLPNVRQRSEAIRFLRNFTGVDLFDLEGAFEVEDEAMAWELTAMAVKHLGALGCYRAPYSENETLKTFMAITGVRFCRADASEAAAESAE